MTSHLEPSPLKLLSGHRFGPYEIVQAVGAGGMGEVYRARDTRLDRTVAIKVLPAHLAGNPELQRRFDREARAISSLNHPHICALNDIGRQDGVDFLVMEYVEGETLAARLAKGPLPLADALRTGIEIADALDKAHRAGIVHRDLKPANIMITKAGSKLLDFGIARLDAAETPQGLTSGSALTGEGRVIGTPQYMAPEQVEGKPADARTDLFAFGMVLYEMLTGRKAFRPPPTERSSRRFSITIRLRRPGCNRRCPKASIGRSPDASPGGTRSADRRPPAFAGWSSHAMSSGRCVPHVRVIEQT